MQTSTSVYHTTFLHAEFYKIWIFPAHKYFNKVHIPDDWCQAATTFLNVGTSSYGGVK